jgi:U11/U12 small nuclear ribonucleoprotein SNRNP65
MPHHHTLLSLLQNYTPGNPASVLYIKNLAKDVVHDDFYYVFGMNLGDCILCFLKCSYENSYI